MIINHKYKYIFIKTEKTAGTSIEIALSKYCDSKDVITPISPKDEIIRTNLSYRGPQNFLIPLKKYTNLEKLIALYNRKRLAFYNHVDSKFIKHHIDKDIWDSYFKFCFERNPFDKVISFYYYHNKTEPRPSLSDYIKSGKANSNRGFDLYTISSRIVVDKVFLYEELSSSMEEISRRINLPEIPSLPNAKSGYRIDKRNYRDLLSNEDKEIIQKVFAREISYFNYVY